MIRAALLLWELLLQQCGSIIDCTVSFLLEINLTNFLVNFIPLKRRILTRLSTSCPSFLLIFIGFISEMLSASTLRTCDF